MKSQGISSEYVNLLRKLYAQQTASAYVSAENQEFSLARRINQEDPISTLLFIAVMEACFRKLKQSWNDANKGEKDNTSEW